VAVIDATAPSRDRLLLRCLWATGGRVSEVLALLPRAGQERRPTEVRRPQLAGVQRQVGAVRRRRADRP